MYKIAVLSSLIFLLLSCNNKVQEAGATKSESRPLTDNVLEGWLSIGGRARTFTPCGTNTPLWVDGPTKEIKQQYLDAKADYEYAPVYVLMEGNLAASRAHPYGQSVAIEQVLIMQEEGPDDCVMNSPGVVSGKGNEPAWNLSIDPDKQTMILRTGYEGDIKELNYVHPQQWINDWTWNTFDANKNPVTIQLIRENCSDSMSGQKYSDQMIVKIGGETLQGCAGKKLR